MRRFHVGVYIEFQRSASSLRY